MWRWMRPVGRQAVVAMATAGIAFAGNGSSAKMERTRDQPQEHIPPSSQSPQPPPFGVSSKPVVVKAGRPYSNVTLDMMCLISGTSHRALAEEIAHLIDVPLANAELKRFADGEVSVQVHDNLRGKDVFIVQTCSAPVNDSIMELLLTVSTCRRSSARRVIAVIPYFGYKHHRRGAHISTKHDSRFLSSSSMDFAKMLMEMGVDQVISVDVQRPGQGHEACFFDNNVPLEAIVTTDHMVQHVLKHIPLQEPVVIVTPNSECVKKARNFQLRLQNSFREEIKLLAFFPAETGSGEHNVQKLEFKGKAEIAGADVLIVDDMVDTAGTLDSLSKRLADAGARNVYLCASHGLFTENAVKRIEAGPVRKVIVTNSLPMPKDRSTKIVQVSVASMLAQVILAEYYRSVSASGGKNEEFEMDD